MPKNFRQSRFSALRSPVSWPQRLSLYEEDVEISLSYSLRFPVSDCSAILSCRKNVIEPHNINGYN